jgi:hypothetical protein
MKAFILCDLVQDTGHPWQVWLPDAILKLDKHGSSYKASWEIATADKICIVKAELNGAQQSVVYSNVDTIVIPEEDLKNNIKTTDKNKIKKLFQRKFEGDFDEMKTAEDVVQAALHKVGPTKTIAGLTARLNRKLT